MRVVDEKVFKDAVNKWITSKPCDECKRHPDGFDCSGCHKFEKWYNLMPLTAAMKKFREGKK